MKINEYKQDHPHEYIVVHSMKILLQRWQAPPLTSIFFQTTTVPANWTLFMKLNEYLTLHKYSFNSQKLQECGLIRFLICNEL